MTAAVAAAATGLVLAAAPAWATVHPQPGPVRAVQAEQVAAYLAALHAQFLQAEGALDATIGAQLASAHAAMTGQVDVVGLGTVYAGAPTVAMPPASNEKLLTAGAALLALGGGYRYTTSVISDVAPNGGVLHGDLAIVASGDPTFGAAQLTALARGVRAHGITTVTGSLVADVAHFDSVRSAPGWKAGYVPTESGALSALMVDHNAAAGAGDPDTTNLATFRAILQQQGVKVAGPSRVGSIPRAATLASSVSGPLSTIVAQTLIPSDNTYAEMLLKQVGWATGRGGTTAGGSAAVRAYAAFAGIPLGTVADGSGLSGYDRESAQTFVRWLEALYASPVWSSIYPALPTACQTGTLVGRLCGVAGQVHAKTGTLDGVATLSGYTHDAAGRLVWFSFMGAGGSTDAERAAIDAAVTTVVRSDLP